MFKVDEDDLNAALEHYHETLGELPAPIQTMLSEMPAVFEGYARMRQAVFSDEARIPHQYKELIFILLDLASGSLDGALVHTRAALSAGLTVEELAEGLAQVVLVLGISNWDRGGAQVLRLAREINTKGQI